MNGQENPGQLRQTTYSNGQQIKNNLNSSGQIDTKNLATGDEHVGKKSSTLKHREDSNKNLSNIRLDSYTTDIKDTCSAQHDIGISSNNRLKSLTNASQCLQLPTTKMEDLPAMSDDLPGHDLDESPGNNPDDLPGIIPEEFSQPPTSSENLCYSAPQRNLNIAYTDEAIYRVSSLIHTLWPSTTISAKKEHPQFCKLYNVIKSYKLPNFLGARIPLPSGLNMSVWQDYLKNYHDIYLCEFLTFGWLLGYNLDVPPVSTHENHPSAIAFPQAIKQFIDTEKGYDAIVGPFTSTPFTPWFRVSPIMTRAKKGTTERRILVDLSYPQNSAVNDGIDPESHLG